MFSSRCLQGSVLVLIVGVLVLGFMLTADVVQEAIASDSDCDEAWDDYGRATLYAHIVCAGNPGSDMCVAAWLRVTYYFYRAIVICMN